MAESLCPLCKSEQFESNLKRNVLLEEIVLCFERLRPDLLEQLQLPENSPLPEQKVTPEHEVIEILDEESASSSAPNPNDNLVLCPVCQQRMEADFLQRSHLDDCLNGKPTKTPPQPRPSTALAKRSKGISSFFQPRKRQNVNHSSFYFSQPEKHHHEIKKIPKIDFTSLATPKLKEKLSQLKLSTSGTRNQLELRYNQYYVLHNSNLDSNRPVSDLELRQKLMQWEKSHAAFSAAALPGGLFADSLSHKCIADKDFPSRLWLDTYKKDYKRLIRAARANRKKKKTADASDSSRTEPNTTEPKGMVDEEAARNETREKQLEDDEKELLGINKGDVAEVGGEKKEAAEFDFTQSTLFVPTP